MVKKIILTVDRPATVYLVCFQVEGHDAKFWLEKAVAAVNAVLVVLYMMTSNIIPKKVMPDNIIESIVQLTKLQLRQLIPFPAVGDTGSHKAKQARSHDAIANNRMNLKLYSKLSEIIGLLSELVELQQLPDNIILQVYAMCFVLCVYFTTACLFCVMPDFVLYP